MKYVVWIWRNTLGIRCNAVVRVIAGIGQVALGLLTVWLSKRFIDETIRNGSHDDIVGMVVVLVLTMVGNILLRQLYYYMSVVANVRQTNSLRRYMFSRIFTCRLYTGRELHSGDVSSRLAKDIDVVAQATTDQLPQMVITVVQLCGAFMLLRYFDRTLAWALLLLTPVALAVGKVIARRLRQMTLNIRKDESSIQMHVQESMEHNAMLRSLNSQHWLTMRLDGMQQTLKEHVMYRTRFTVVTRLLLGMTFGLGYLLAFVWGGLQLRSGAITFGVMTSFLQLVGQIQSPVLHLLNMIPSMIHATASIDRLQELAGENDEAVQVGDGHRIEKNGERGVVFDDVSYCYTLGGRDIVSHFSHVFRAGTKTAVMGETGAGKTTLFRLILGLIHPTQGTVTTGRGVCYVPQGNTLMSGTIRYNLLLANPQATDDELWQVLKVACAGFVGDLPDGLDTELGERGGGLSEGQAQRIAIARGLLCEGDVMLLDEISSALDEETERELFSRLFEKFPHKTIILITHRTVVAELCDDIISL